MVTLGEIALSDSEKAEALADSLEAQFQPLNDPSELAVIEMVDVTFREYAFAPACEPKSTNPTDIQDAIRSFKVDRALSPNGIPNWAL